ncbi:RagB/SusD family nutrient uptake outer membrane protein [Paraflavitalea sp. CAU 1676]|uniref:RagB/SusD family nutrient uptake outer membrane protein n=1 Tax=Paraflavitalea sp. CAU 1676 TaxID=3032598 RepID=UPI0023DA7728|nr:RagB/SusD family nutrient uptake outer membrane protein [Paraflavitalea sp. CAU 1676]MDF2189617.1 RagB/SusD family nutrient uptake outer membrane protein [Paraflavitalea sp. CAU 1676]
MKKPILYLALLTSLVACKKGKVNNNPDPGPDDRPPASLGVEVFNATRWSTTQPYGVAAAGAKVSLFRSASDYPGAPAAVANTNADGRVVFPHINAGEYYIVAEQDYMYGKISNVLFYQAGVGGFTADSLWQAAPGPSESPSPLNGAAGNFRFKDLNSDGKIDFNDRESFPAVKVKFDQNKNVAVKVMMGAIDNRQYARLADGAAINAALNLAYTKMAAWHEFQAVLDAVYTDEYDCTSLAGSWCAINTYQTTAANQAVTKFWTDGWALVSAMGNIIANTELVSDLTVTEKKVITGQAKALKGAVCLQLTNYFGSLPNHEWISIPYYSTRMNQTETFGFIETWLLFGKPDLKYGGLHTHRSKMSLAACDALLARLYLQQGAYQKAFDQATAVIDNYGFNLGTGSTALTQNNSPEVIWSTKDDLGDEVKVTFNRGNILPELRLTEMLLIYAEAGIALGRFEQARLKLNQVRSRSGLGVITSSDPVVLREILQGEWSREMGREGVRLAALARWSKTSAVLGPLGLNAHQRFLPIPAGYLQWYYAIVQNPGYN